MGLDIRTDPRTRQDYPEDGTIVRALFDGSAHWYTGTVHHDPDGHRMDCPELEGRFLEGAAHWYEL